MKQLKQLVVFTLAFACAWGAFAQGLINFDNRVNFDAVFLVAPVYGPEPSDPTKVLTGNAITNGGYTSYTGRLLLGTGFTAALFGGPLNTPVEELGLVSQVTFRTTAAAAGFFRQILAPTVPGVPGGQRATFQVRAWDNQGGTIVSWAAVLANPNVARGVSDVFSPPSPLVEPPFPIGYLVGLTSFNIHVVPEPAVAAVGLLGLGALLFRRRR